MQSHTLTHTLTHTHIHLHTLLHTLTYTVHTLTYTYTNFHTHLYTHSHTLAHTFTHTHTYAHIHAQGKNSSVVFPGFFIFILIDSEFFTELIWYREQSLFLYISCPRGCRMSSILQNKHPVLQKDFISFLYIYLFY